MSNKCNHNDVHLRMRIDLENVSPIARAFISASISLFTDPSPDVRKQLMMLLSGRAALGVVAGKPIWFRPDWPELSEQLRERSNALGSVLLRDMGISPEGCHQGSDLLVAALEMQELLEMAQKEELI